MHSTPLHPFFQWYWKKQSITSGGLPKRGCASLVLSLLVATPEKCATSAFSLSFLPQNSLLSIIFFIMKRLDVCIAWHVVGNFMLIFNQLEVCPCPGLGHLLQRKCRLAFPTLGWRWANLRPKPRQHHTALSSSAVEWIWWIFSAFSSCFPYLSLSWQFSSFTPFSAILSYIPIRKSPESVKAVWYR